MRERTKVAPRGAAYLLAYFLPLAVAALVVPARHGQAMEAIRPAMDWIPAVRRLLELSNFPLATAAVMLMGVFLAPLPMAWTRDRIAYEQLQAKSFNQVLRAATVLSLPLLGLLFMAMQDGYSAELSRVNALPFLMCRSRIALALGAAFLGIGLAGLIVAWWETWREAWARL